MTQADDDFTIWASSQPRGRGQLGLRGAVLKQGTQVAKVVTVADYGDQQTGEIRKRELSFRTVPRRPLASGYDFDNPIVRWACENEEVERLLAFLESEGAPRGRYRVVDTASPAAAALQILTGATDLGGVAQALAAEPGLAGLLRAVASTDAGRLAAADVALAERRDLVAVLQHLAATPGITETDMQARIGDAYWLFGGRYVGVAGRRNLTPLDQHDIPLLGADGTLHVVELKGPDIPKLIRRHRNHWIVGNDVHEAVSQAMNYLRALDELGPGLETTYRNELGQSYDMRRVFATVVIGHPAHLDSVGEFGIPSEATVEQTLRSYNAHLSRLEVVTFKSLLDAAARALEFEQTVRDRAGDDDSVAASPCESADAPPSSGRQAPVWGDEPPF